MAAREAKTGKTQTLAKNTAPAKARPLWNFQLALLLAVLIIFMSLAVFVFYYSAQEYIAEPVESHGVRVVLFSPKYLSVGDEEQVWVTVVNERSTPAQITVTLVYTEAFLCLAGDNGSHRLDLGTVYPQERITRKLTVFFPLGLEWQYPLFRNFPGLKVDFGVWLAVDDQPIQKKTIPLSMIPLIRARSLLGIIIGILSVGFILQVGKAAWELLKQIAIRTEFKA